MPDGLRRLDIAVALLGFLPVVVVGLDSGGFYARTWYLGTFVVSVVAVLAVARRAPPLGIAALGFVLALAALAIWALCSALWGEPGTSAVDEAVRTSFYAVSALALVVLVDRASTPALVAGVWGAVVFLCAYGLVDRFIGSSTLSPFQGTLLFEPIGYANALGVVAAMGTLLGLGLVRRAETRLLKAFVAVATVVIATALVLTESRGAWVALACGLVVLGGPALVRSTANARRRALAFGVVAVVLVGVPLVARQSISLGHRPSYWRAALEDALEHPVLGSGAGTFDNYWLEHRDLEVSVRDAHSLYLESLAELGVVGLALVVLVVAIPLVTAARAPRHGLMSAASAAFVAFAIHAGVDWDWEVPVTVIMALSCAAILLADGTSERRGVVLGATESEREEV